MFVRSLKTAAIASVAIAVLSTVGDFIWAHWIPEHRVVFGLAHGALLFTAVGRAIGITAHKPLQGAIGGAAIGAAAAGSYYLMAPVLGFAAMFVAWFGIWLALAVLIAAVRTGPVAWGVVAARGVVAALASGLAFYLVSGIWRPFDPAGWDYLVHFAAWTVAYFPGFAALGMTGRGKA